MCLVQRLQESFNRLCTGDGIFAVEDEERNTVDADLARFSDIGMRCFGILLILQSRFTVCRGKAKLFEDF